VAGEPSSGINRDSRTRPTLHQNQIRNLGGQEVRISSAPTKSNQRLTPTGWRGTQGFG